MLASKASETSIHFSRMRTARFLTVSGEGDLHSGWVLHPEGLHPGESASGGSASRGACIQEGGGLYAGAGLSRPLSP